MAHGRGRIHAARLHHHRGEDHSVLALFGNVASVTRPRHIFHVHTVQCFPVTRNRSSSCLFARVFYSRCNTDTHAAYMAPKAKKVHTSALCFIPPIEAQEEIQRLRSQYDRQINRWPPHVNLCYPFVPLHEFEAGASRLAAALHGMAPFEINFRRLRHFAHSKTSFTAWLEPEVGASEWQALITLCTQAFPHCTDQTARGAFVPHLTVGQFSAQHDVDALEKALSKSWEPLCTSVTEVALISRAGQDEPFLVHWRVLLGSGTAVRVETPSRGVWLPASAPSGSCAPSSACAPAGTHTGSAPAGPPASASACHSTVAPFEEVAGENAASNDTVAATSMPSARVRISLASNANRNVCSVVLTNSSANLKELQALAKNKLRLNIDLKGRAKGGGGFYRDGGDLLLPGGRLVQVHTARAQL